MTAPAHPGSADHKGFRWPAPPNFEFVREKDATGWSDCALTFRDGASASGRLQNFLADAAQLTFQPRGGSETVSIPFSVLLKLQLPRALKLKREILPTRLPAEGEAQRRSEHYSFRIELVNGERFMGMTLGYVSALCGLFLYFPEANGDVVRCFVPAQAAKTCSIDAPIGQVLVDQNAVSPEAVEAALNLQAMMRSQRLGQYLTQNGFVSPEQLAEALELKRNRPDKRLGEALMDLGHLSGPELDMALSSEAMERTMPIGQILLRKMGIVNENAINGAMANKQGIPLVDLKAKIPLEILARIPAALAHRRRVVPLCEAEGALIVAIENPMDHTALEELSALTRMKILPVSAPAEDIASSLRRHYGAAPDSVSAAPGIIDRRKASRLAPSAADPMARTNAGIQELLSRLSAESGNQDFSEQQVISSDSALVGLVNRVILDAVEQKASDIHNRGEPGTQDHAHPLSQGREPGELSRAAGAVPQRPVVADKDHEPARHY